MLSLRDKVRGTHSQSWSTPSVLTHVPSGKAVAQSPSFHVNKDQHSSAAPTHNWHDKALRAACLGQPLSHALEIVPSRSPGPVNDFAVPVTATTACAPCKSVTNLNHRARLNSYRIVVNLTIAL